MLPSVKWTITKQVYGLLIFDWQKRMKFFDCSNEPRCLLNWYWLIYYSRYYSFGPQLQCVHFSNYLNNNWNFKLLQHKLVILNLYHTINNNKQCIYEHSGYFYTLDYSMKLYAVNANNNKKDITVN